MIMNNWSACLDLLEGNRAPIQVFFRDDDAGWENDRLYRLLDLFAAQNAPIDLAVIPDALDPAAAQVLLERRRDQPIGLHQHGFSHANHEAEGRKCEFGPTRSAAKQREDIADGMKRLSDAFGYAVDPIFTPPWNRCTQATVDSLVSLEFQALSRNVGAAALQPRNLMELPISVDWQRKTESVPSRYGAFSEALVRATKDQQPLGIMLHHGVAAPEDRLDLARLLDKLNSHPGVELILMRSLLQWRNDGTTVGAPLSHSSLGQR